MNLSIVLPLRNQKDLADLLKSLYDPSAPNYHHFLSVNEFTDEFGPSAADYQKVVEFARANGFTVDGLAPNRLVVSFSGTVEQVQKTFNVTMRTYQHPTENRAFFSPDREPSIALNVPIAHITGLNNFSVPRTALLPPSTSRSFSAQSVQGSGPGGSYLASDMRTAYYGGTSLTGAGQTVALVQFDGYSIADAVSTLGGTATAETNGSNYVISYTPPGGSQTYTIPINNVLIDGATGAPGQFQSPAADAEQALDIAQAIGMAPGVSQIRVYIGSLDSDILNSIASENIAKVVSISWGWTPDDPSTDDPIFEEFAAQGQSVFVASGDYGAYSGTYPYYYPAEDDWVTAVGGTTLTTNGAGGAWQAETTWDRSGGGISPDAFPIEGWQSGLATVTNGGSNTHRNVPDVAMEGNYDNYACNLGQCTGGWAGTSFASPRWAAFTALINQQSVASSGTPVGFFNIPLYAAAGTGYQETFHDIAIGNNGYVYGYSFTAAPGYDLVTGWGSPNGQNLIDLLAPRGADGFQITATPNIVTIVPSTSNTIAVEVRDSGAFNGAVSLAISGLPSGVTPSFSPDTTTGSSTLTLTVSNTVLGGTFFPQIVGTAGAFSASANISLTIGAPTSVVTITSPAAPLAPIVAPTFKPGAQIPLVGSIVGSFQSILIQWAEGTNPTSGWTSSGITPNSALSNPATNVTLGTWDTTGITQPDWYSLRVSATVAGTIYTATTIVYLEPSLMSSAWPQWLNAWSNWFQGPVPTVDGTGTPRVAFATEHMYSGQDIPQIRSLTVDGSSSLSLIPPNGLFSQPASGNLDMGLGEALVNTDGGQVDVFRPDGTTYALVPDPSLPKQAFWSRSPIIVDVDGDSLPEVVAIGRDITGSNPQPLAYIYAWRNDGSLVSGNFPFTVAESNYTLAANGAHRIVVGDINGDGAKEFVVIEGTSVGVITPRLFSANGTQLPWGAQPIGGYGEPCQLSLADLDHNGLLETIILICGGNIHVLQPDGTERPGWPSQSLPVMIGGIAVGDLNQDGHEEIIASGGNLYVFNTDGTTFSGNWPKLGDLNPTLKSYEPLAKFMQQGDLEVGMPTLE